jgi:hypothetical protein
MTALFLIIQTDSNFVENNFAYNCWFPTEIDISTLWSTNCICVCSVLREPYDWRVTQSITAHPLFSRAINQVVIKAGWPTCICWDAWKGAQSRNLWDPLPEHHYEQQNSLNTHSTEAEVSLWRVTSSMIQTTIDLNPCLLITLHT